jgi:imidazolonepropionase-like amidohydrolase
MERIAIVFAVLCLTVSASAGAQSTHEADVTFTGATVWTGDNRGVIEDAVMIVRDGRLQRLGSADEISVPAEARTVDLQGRFVIPGLINAHGHVGMADGLETGEAVHSRDNVIRQLRLYAHYGITTVVSLGDEPPQAFDVRNEMDAQAPGMARLFLSGPVVEGVQEENVRRQVRERAAQDADWTKIRVDDQLGQSQKMPEPVYAAVIDESHRHGIPHASHMVYLEDARRLLVHGAEVLAHSVRDEPVDDDLIQRMIDGERCITPTLTRELSTFIYAERPAFFDDPFFLKHADAAVLEELQRPEVQARFTGAAADYYREALPLAIQNMMRIHESGARVAMGTDSGPPARFQGYFEHLEMEMMYEAGMSAEDVLRSATSVAAECMRLEDVGRLEPGSWADFVVLEGDPLQDFGNLRRIEAVYLAGERFE